MERKRKIAILGSTGSIGKQAIEVILSNPDLFEVELLTANENYGLLASQAAAVNANNAVICRDEFYDKASSLLSGSDVKVFSGMDSVCSLVQSDDIDIVLASMVGFSGLRPVLKAIESGKTIAIANKEILVCAGEAVTGLSMKHSAPLIPVDSEHSAIFQCLQGSFGSPVDELIITASGGPFREYPAESLSSVTPEQALDHPRWKMGKKVTVDSATMMNKGFEVIEARWLFGIPSEQISVVTHPESIIHSMVRFQDGAIMAQMGMPDMRIPIQYALTYPYRQPAEGERLDLFALGKLTFHKPDTVKFPALDTARRALDKGGNACCVMSGADEEAVNAFIQGRIRFTDIVPVIEETLATVPFIQGEDIGNIFESDRAARETASRIIKKIEK
ncbi:1-deoxy-D-xylulose-5-phosphate reductoisomerase [Muribaculum sp. An289]|uniref:1-deoxy-D-xylulose-5-phosphate reductoisomerase n=1 Tax=unclassified Muribaculum TaxID=2622126 RepID=UPI000B3AD9A4|nr:MULTISPECIES: 1-deoxy-D-xylulose-5-phosphate reductoisomerase [unclassified Muribaculum]OUO35176.1 1-deoxy-D-xylulose-5-phosphate reductoisomerase [Muribaculum sp. An289]OUO40323.1 1-deoxy-D-xylulose-5-phosphate reductoisomerase [Muribaculum sp. An287]